jgi:asparagine synthetase B (glutamine-hydrolysing)
MLTVLFSRTVFTACTITYHGFSTGTTGSGWQHRWKCGCLFSKTRCSILHFHLPRRAKLHRGVGKWLVKQAAADVLPRDIVYAKKRGFPVSSRFWRGTERLLVGGRLADLMEWPVDSTRQIINRLKNDRYLRFHLVGLELWARIFLMAKLQPRLAKNSLLPLELSRAVT